MLIASLWYIFTQYWFCLSVSAILVVFEQSPQFVSIVFASAQTSPGEQRPHYVSSIRKKAGNGGEKSQKRYSEELRYAVHQDPEGIVSLFMIIESSAGCIQSSRQGEHSTVQ